MKQSKLLKALQECDLGLLFRFSLFLQSPYFNKKKSLIVLWEEIEKKLRQRKGPLDESEVLASLTNKLRLSDKSLKNALSNLLSLFTRFLAHEKIEQNPSLQLSLSLEQLAEMKDSGLFLLKSKQYEKSSAENEELWSEGYFYQYKLLNHQHHLQELENRSEYPDKLITAIEKFETYAVIEQLILLNRMYAYRTFKEKVLSADMEKRITDLLRFITQRWTYFQNEPLLQLFYYAFLVQKEASEDAFNKLYHTMIGEQAGKIHFENANNLYSYIENYCIYQINRGNQQYYEQYLKSIQIKQAVYDIKVKEWDYKNLTLTYCRLGRIDEALQFVKDKQKDLPVERQKNAYAFNLATIKMYEKKYYEAITLLQTIKYIDHVYYIGAKTRIVKIYYDLGEYQAIFSVLDTIRLYFIRNKNLTTARRQVHLNFIRFVRKLTRLKTRKDYTPLESYTQKMEALHHEIQQEEVLHNKAWLLQETSTQSISI